jgi:gamma-glutamyl-gamma-aminobutyrate hydrolase PuuD
VDKEIYGIMWHPERENPFNKVDKLFLKMVFGG